MHAHIPRTGPRAFTLIELLTVIAIIGILAAIIIPTVGRVRDSARTAQCSSNVRQLAQACLLYANENRGQLVPARNTADGGRIWRAYVAPYLGSVYDARSVFACPSDPASRASTNLLGQAPASYGLNFASQYLNGASVLHQFHDNTGSRLLNVVRNPARLVMIADIGCSSGGSATEPSTWTPDTAKNLSLGYARFPWGGSFGQISDWTVWPRHGGGRTTSAAFYDGSARQLDLVKDLLAHPEGTSGCLFDNH